MMMKPRRLVFVNNSSCREHRNRGSWLGLLMICCFVRARAAFVVVANSNPAVRRSSSLCTSRDHRERSLWVDTTLPQHKTQTLFAQSNRVNGVNGDASSDQADPSDTRSSSSPSSSGGTPQTGWNHNPPAPDSKFWQRGGGGGGGDESSGARESARASPGRSSSSTPLRTGWLHNTEPPRPQPPVQQSSATLSSSSSPPSSQSLARERLNQAMRDQFRSRLNHRLVCATVHATHTNNAVASVTEHIVSVPLRHASSVLGGQTSEDRLDVFFTVVEKVTTETEWLHDLCNPSLSPQERATLYREKAALTTADSLLLYLQGGPGFGAPVPVAGLGLGKDASWLAAAWEHGFPRIVLLDQRGCGRSTPVTKQFLELRFPDLFALDGAENPSEAPSLEEHEQLNPAAAAAVRAAVDSTVEYLSHFRCDSIVQDAELVRQALLVDPDTDPSVPEPPRPWGGALGQSFGGFCLLNYLSSVDHPPKIALFTGGIPPMLTPLGDVYRKLWHRVQERTLRYYDLYPGDVAVVKRLVRRLLENPVPLPSGGTLTARRLLQLGLRLGSSPSSFATLHNLLANALVDGTDDFRRSFLKEMEIEQSFDDHPIYYWLHEPSCYADGDFNGATNWAAHATYEDLKLSSDEWDYRVTCQDTDPRPVLWFGEHVFPWMATDYAELSGVGLSAVADALARKSDWGALYRAEPIRAALKSSRCQAAAAVYYEDMYVEFDASVKVSARGSPLERCKLYITNEYQHSGLRDDGAKIFSMLYGMATGRIRTPS